MASPTTEVSLEGGKLPAEVSDSEQPQEIDAHHVDYPTERVEAVYR